MIYREIKKEIVIMYEDERNYRAGEGKENFGTDKEQKTPAEQARSEADSGRFRRRADLGGVSAGLGGIDRKGVLGNADRINQITGNTISDYPGRYGLGGRVSSSSSSVRGWWFWVDWCCECAG